MEHHIDKLSPKSLPEQVCAILRDRIAGGQYPAGTRISGVRVIASELNVSQVTVLKAMEQLETEKYLIRIPARGIFVSEHIPDGKPKRVVFVFPEKSISPDELSGEAWAMSAELHRGLLVAAQEYRMQVVFDHVDDHLDDMRIFSEVSRLQEYDAAVFVGKQLWPLQQALLRHIPLYNVGNAADRPPGVIMVDYDRSAALELIIKHAVERNFQSVGTLRFDGDEKEMFLREEEFRRMAELAGITVKAADCPVFPTADSDRLYRALAAYFQRGDYPEFIFCNNAEKIINVYEVLLDLNLRPGRDLALAGIASGLTFRGLLPSYTHVRVPMFDMGCAIIRHIASETPAAVMPLSAPLIVGKSTGNTFCQTNIGEV